MLIDVTQLNRGNIERKLLPDEAQDDLFVQERKLLLQKSEKGRR